VNKKNLGVSFLTRGVCRDELCIPPGVELETIGLLRNCTHDKFHHVRIPILTLYAETEYSYSFATKYAANFCSKFIFTTADELQAFKRVNYTKINTVSNQVTFNCTPHLKILLN
jgi:hypothetical protein